MSEYPLSPLIRLFYLFSESFSYFFFLFLFCSVFAGECIPPRTTALAASTFHLYVSLASLDVNTFQVSLPFNGWGVSWEFQRKRQTSNVVRRRLNKSKSQPASS